METCIEAWILAVLMVGSLIAAFLAGWIFSGVFREDDIRKRISDQVRAYTVKHVDAHLADVMRVITGEIEAPKHDAPLLSRPASAP